MLELGTSDLCINFFAKRIFQVDLLKKGSAKIYVYNAKGEIKKI
jgi:hypothetical protein